MDSCEEYLKFRVGESLEACNNALSDGLSQGESHIAFMKIEIYAKVDGLYSCIYASLYYISLIYRYML